MGIHSQYLGVLSLLLLWAVAFSADTRVSELSREINLLGYVARITDTATFSGSVSTAHFCFPSGHWENAASLHCAVGDDKRALLSHAGASGIDKQHLANWHQIRANPAEVPQSQAQLVEYKGTIQAISPYPVDSQTVSLRLASDKVLELSEPEGVKATTIGGVITYKGIKNTPPFSADPLRVHFKSNKPFVNILDMQREITVSHWGRVYVTERFHVKHGGALVKGPFSRWNITAAGMQDPKDYVTPYIYSLTAFLHPMAEYVSLKDDLGNIMTLSQGKVAGMLSVTFSPRYPLLGGWQSHFVLGYSLPLQAAVNTNAQGRRELVFGQSPMFDEDFFAESVTTRVIVPEGSSDVDVDLGRLKAHVSDDRTFTYLDSMIGRPTKVIQGGRMTGDDADAMVKVSYTFAPAFAALEPALLVGTFAALFLLWLVASRTDLTIVKGQEWKARQAEEKARDVRRKARAAVATLEDHAATVTSMASTDGDSSKQLAGTVTALKSKVSEIEACLEELKQLGSTKAAEMATLLESYTKLVADAQKVQNGKGKDKKLLCSEVAATLAKTQVAKAAALAGV